MKATGASVARAHIRQQISGKATSPSTLVTEYLEAAKKKTTLSDKVAVLHQLVGWAQNKKFSGKDHNRFAQRLNALFKKRSTNDAAGLEALKNLLMAAANSPLLSAKQQQYVTTVMLKTMEQKEAVKSAPKPSPKPVVVPKREVKKEKTATKRKMPQR